MVNKVRCEWSEGCTTILNSHNKTKLCGAHQIIQERRDRAARRQRHSETVSEAPHNPKRVPELQFRHLTTRSIIEAVTEYYQVPVEHLSIKTFRGTGKKAIPIQVSCCLMRELLKMSFPHIGAVLKRDHGTVIHSCNRIKELMEDDSDLRAAVEQISASLKA